MKKINGILAKEMTQAQKSQYVRRYALSQWYSVRKFYKAPSPAKQLAEEYILIRMNKANGYGYKILGGNTFGFSAGYIVGDNMGVYLIAETQFGIYYTDIER